MINLPIAEQRARESFAGFPERVPSAYLAYAEKGDLPNLDTVVLGVLQFYMPKKPAEQLDALPGSTRLVDDLGCDSLTMIDVVFMVESLFDVKVDDAELPRIVTLDDLRSHLRRLISAPASLA